MDLRVRGGQVKLRASHGTLGFLNGKVPPGMRTAYFMLDGRCVFDCAFCTHARNATSDARYLSRMVWKEIDIETAIEIASKDPVRRICLQTVSYPGYREDLIRLIRLLNFKKVSVSVRALSMSEIDSYFEAGVDRIGIPVDAVTEELFSKLRVGSLKRHLSLIEKASKEYPGKVTTHIVVGLGETEKEAVEMIWKMNEIGVKVALFAFTPMRGTHLENHPRPSMESYRRIQIARYLIENGIVKMEDFVFNDDGEMVDFGVDVSKVDVKRAFLTSGCEDCTRPFYNERPGEEPYNVHDESLLKNVQIPPMASFNTSTTVL